MPDTIGAICCPSPLAAGQPRPDTAWGWGRGSRGFLSCLADAPSAAWWCGHGGVHLHSTQPKRRPGAFNTGSSAPAPRRMGRRFAGFNMGSTWGLPRFAQVPQPSWPRHSPTEIFQLGASGLRVTRSRRTVAPLGGRHGRQTGAAFFARVRDPNKILVANNNYSIFSAPRAGTTATGPYIFVPNTASSPPCKSSHRHVCSNLAQSGTAGECQHKPQTPPGCNG
jgi:hypothetical protein